jgi:TDG/mug DNA glycosylase family protein
MAARFVSPPTKQELLAARGRPVADVIAPYLGVLFCGINPGLYSGAVGRHFARPGNRFWAALFAAGLTDRLLTPYDEGLLLEYGYGITNIVNRATAQASELSIDELREGARELEKKAVAFRPENVAVLGIDAYRKAFRRPRARLGRQPEKIGGAALWVLPNPSGINASYQMADLVRLFSELRSGFCKTTRPALPN